MLLTLLLALTLTLATTILAQTSPSFDLEWNVIASGGGESTSASYRVEGTVGQSVASQLESNSAGYVVTSGYWSADTGLSGARLYLPIVYRN
jgi:hypothetical protein